MKGHSDTGFSGLPMVEKQAWGHFSWVVGWLVIFGWWFFLFGWFCLNYKYFMKKRNLKLLAQADLQLWCGYFEGINHRGSWDKTAT